MGFWGEKQLPEYPHFSDFGEEDVFDGDKKRIDDILNQEVLILKFKIKNSTKRKGTLYATIQFRLDEEEYVLFTGSNVIIDQLKRYEEHMPFYATFRKIDRYYTLS
jgi:hypothetical protein